MLNEAIEIPQETLTAWEQTVSTIAEATAVDACLIMRGNETSMEVMARSLTQDNPYEPRETAPRRNELYCETVIATRLPLMVRDCRADPEWMNNPDEKLGMVSYFGIPIEWPNGENFGTLCILDKNPREPTDPDIDLLKKYSKLIENNLATIAKKARGIDS